MIPRIIIIFEQKNMALLIADSGSTKTSWAYKSELKEHIFETSGLNPAQKADEEISSILLSELLPKLPNRDIEALFFYGAGCGAREKAERIQKILHKVLPSTAVTLKTDIEGAGRSLFPNQTGIAVISGTGSSAGFIEDGKLVDIMPSKVYPEGDLGSGCHIGSLVLSDYFEGKTPDMVKEAIELNLSSGYDRLLVQFQNPDTSKAITAKVMRDVSSLAGSEYLHQRAYQSVQLLLEQLVKHFREALNQFPVKLMGSTAFYFGSVFREVFGASMIGIEEILQNPIQALIAFHTANNG